MNEFLKEQAAWKQLLSENSTRRSYQQALVKADTQFHALLETDVEKGALMAAASQETGKLGGIPFTVKDNIAVNGFQFTCGSKMLEGLISPFTATSVQRLTDAGAVPVAKSNLDEFGMGSSTENSAFSITRNPWNTDMVPGGSSGGAAASVASGMVPFALGSDTGGSVRQPAAFCGVYGLKPTYGRISRYGLAAYASSMESVGILSDDLGLMRSVFQTVQGKDVHDQSSIDCRDYEYENEKPLTIAVFRELEGTEPEIERGYRTAIEAVRSLGWNVKEIQLPSLAFSVPSFYTIAMAEASANLARYTGVRYGYRAEGASNQEEMVRKTREEAFGAEVKLRILLGTYVLRSGFQDQYYLKAQKIRTKIRRELERLFQEVQAVLTPVFPVMPYASGAGLTSMQQKIADRYTITANLTGIPALSFPACVENGLPVGMQLMGPACAEHLLFSAVQKLSDALPAVQLPKVITPQEVLNG